MIAEIHQKIHREFEPKDAHVECKNPVDTLIVGAAVSIIPVDHADAELAQQLDASPGAPVDCRLQQRDNRAGLILSDLAGAVAPSMNSVMATPTLGMPPAAKSAMSVGY
jgi:hypothetical protein